MIVKLHQAYRTRVLYRGHMQFGLCTPYSASGASVTATTAGDRDDLST
jgi:hypothetical protein